MNEQGPIVPRLPVRCKQTADDVQVTPGPDDVDATAPGRGKAAQHTVRVATLGAVASGETMVPCPQSGGRFRLQLRTTDTTPFTRCRAATNSSLGVTRQVSPDCTTTT